MQQIRGSSAIREKLIDMIINIVYINIFSSILWIVATCLQMLFAKYNQLIYIRYFATFLASFANSHRPCMIFKQL